MSNENNPEKKKLQVWVSASMLAQIDGAAARKGLTRAGVVSEALSAHLAGERPATVEDLASVSAKLDAMAARQAATAAALAEAIRNQPIAVQEAPALPEAGGMLRGRKKKKSKKPKG